jgi:hypothetical protein
MLTLTTIFNWAGFGGPIKRNERDLWASTRNMRHLCVLTAGWLEGRVQSQPGYYGSSDLDEVDGLLDALVALNEAGFLTNGSQEGFDGIGYDGNHWRQLAAVTGFATDEAYHRLLDALEGTRFGILAYPCKTRRFGRPGPGVVVTFCADAPFTTFGSQMDAGEIAFTYDGCGEDAIQSVCEALQVAVYDPEPGSNDLWDALRQAAGR